MKNIKFSKPNSVLLSSILLASLSTTSAMGFGNEIIISEFMSHTDEPFVDALELYNQGNETIKLDGWYLTDSDRLRTSSAYQIKKLTMKPGEYVTFRIGENEQVSEFALKGVGSRLKIAKF